jgi:DNA polymerase-3 subunit alpha
LYVSDHPLSAYREDLEMIVTHWSAELGEAEHQTKVRVAGMVTHIRPFQSRNGRAMAFATIEDLQGSIELILFPSVWEKAKSIVKEDAVLVAAGKAESGSGMPRVLADSVTADLKKALAAARKSGIARAPAPAAPPPAAEEDWYPPPADPMEEALIMEPQSAVAAANPMPIAAAGTSPAGTDEPQSAIAAVNPTAVAATNPTPIAVAGPSPAGTDVSITGTSTAGPAKIEGPRLILLYIRESGDRARDTRRLRILYGLLSSYPGTDHFAFQVSESERTYRLEFPTNTTSWTPDLERKVLHLVGAGCVEIQPFCVQ